MKLCLRPFLLTLAIVLPLGAVFAVIAAAYDLPVAALGLGIGVIAGGAFVWLSRSERGARP